MKYRIKVFNENDELISDNTLDETSEEYLRDILYKQNKERKEREAELNRISKKYKQLFEFMPIGVSLADKNGNLIENNKEAERLLGLSSKEHNERSIDGEEWKIIKKDFSIMPPEEFASVRALKENKLIENVEMGIWKNENNITWINVTAIPKTYDEGVIISYTDISEKVQRENQLKELIATKDKFSSIIAHDLRNPFNAILGFSDLLATNISELSLEEIQELANMINTSAQRGYRLLENLLEWSRLHTGQIKPNFEKARPSDLIYEVQLLNEQIAKNKDIDIQIDINCNNFIWGDKEMIKAVLRNLVSNALKFTHKGGKVQIETVKLENNLLFTVSDTGLGIDQEDIETLFRIDSNLSKKGTDGEEGSGLGLILCQEFVNKNNGKIWVESEPGKGSKFKFLIPFWIE